LRDKVRAISKMIPNASLGQLSAEIAKCEVRCANCHRRKTAERRASPPLSLRAIEEAARSYDAGRSVSGP
jgi:hypothetical protein